MFAITQRQTHNREQRKTLKKIKHCRLESAEHSEAGCGRNDGEEWETTGSSYRGKERADGTDSVEQSDH